MRRHLQQRTALSAGLGAAVVIVLAVAGASVPATAAAIGPARAAVPVPARPASPGGSAAARGAAARPVLLINGDRLMIATSPRGGPAVSLLPAATGDSLTSLKLGSLTAEIPADALPYLGRGLDLSLFELGALRRAEAGGKLQVRLTFAGRRPALPGITIASSRLGTADGYLTAASARVFGAALGRQFRADHARASYGADGLFGDGVRIALAGAAAPAAPARPDFPMHTLTVTASDLSGKADNGDLAWVFNADNLATFGNGNENLSFFYHGVAKFSVPAGHYWAFGDFADFTPAAGSQRLVFLPQFTVGRRTRVHIAESAASSEITMATPRPAIVQAVNFEVDRGSRHGPAADFTWTDMGVSLWVSPTTRKPTVGTLNSFASEQLTAPSGPGTPYAYSLDYAAPDGIITAQHYVATHANLATVHERYYQDVHSTGLWYALGGFPEQLGSTSTELPVTLPGLQTQYLSAARALTWSSGYFAFNPPDGNSWGGQSEDSYRVLAAGRRQTVDWNRYPLHPQPYVFLGGLGGIESPLMPSAVRAGDLLSLDTTPFSDNQPGHLGEGFSAGPGVTLTGSYAIYQDGTPIASGNPVDGIPVVQLRPGPSVISFTLDAGRWGSVFPLAPSSQTVWTWRSARKPGVTLPAAWHCGLTATGQPLSRCVVQPMMTLNYLVQRLALNGSVPPGHQAVDVSVGHIQPGRALPVTGARAQVSDNDGQTWAIAPVTRSGAGKFRIAFTAPGGVDVTLRVSATDAAGGSITETILRAYRVTF